MLYVRQPTAEEGVELKRPTRREVGRVSRRAQMVLRSARRRTVPAVAALFAVSRATVRFWLRRFDAAGPAGLRDEPRHGRPRKVTPQVETDLATWLRQDPQQADPRYLATFWTVAMLLLTPSREVQLARSPTALRATLHRLGLRWRRPRLAMPRKTDPEEARKQWQIAGAVIGAGPEAAVLYADESRVQPLPLVRAMWSWVGQQWRVPTPGSNTRRARFGALELRTGRWTYLVRERMRKDDFIAFLGHLLLAYPCRPIIPVVDNDSSHTAGEVKAWLAAHPRPQLYYLPTHCSHLNPVERIWLQVKGDLAANRLYGSIKPLLATVDRFFAAMTPEQALVWAAAEK
jgi:transposase